MYIYTVAAQNTSAQCLYIYNITICLVSWKHIELAKSCAARCARSLWMAPLQEPSAGSFGCNPSLYIMDDNDDMDDAE